MIHYDNDQVIRGQGYLFGDAYLIDFYVDYRQPVARKQFLRFTREKLAEAQLAPVAEPVCLNAVVIGLNTAVYSFTVKCQPLPVRVIAVPWRPE